MIRCTICLEAIDANLRRGVQIPTGFGVERWRVTGAALAGAGKHEFPPPRGARIKAASGRAWSGKRQLIKLQGGELARDQVRLVLKMTEACPRSDRKLAGIVEPRIVKGPLTVHFEGGYEGVPVRDRTPSGPSMEVHPGKSECRRNEYGRVASVGPKRLAVQYQLGVKVSGTPAVQDLDDGRDIDSEQIGDRRQIRGEGDDGSDVQIPIGPSVEAMPDAGCKGVIDGRMAQ